jgi:eukaryotic-like serine/threonine-protein kinase
MEQATAQDRLLGAKVGNYEVKQKLGEGGMGAVYLAVHPNIGKRVALKVLHPEFSSNQEVIARFFNEAKAVNDIQHPNIVDIIDYGEMPPVPGGTQKVVYFIMEFLAGQSLAKLIRDQAPFAPDRAQLICMQIADALGASHRAGIVHRDLKPDNVMISTRRDGRDLVKVLDFGIAKLTGDQPGSRRTRTGIVMGTPAYMSPEQCEGRGQIDHRTDIYSLGTLLFEMLTAEVPFRGEGYGEVLVQHMTHVPPRPTAILPSISVHLEAVCLKALEKRPAERYQDMESFLRALQDPVGYVEGHGGVDRFVTYNQAVQSGEFAHLYMPTPSRQYPVHVEPGPYTPAHARTTTPAPADLTGSGPIGLLTPMPHLAPLLPPPADVPSVASSAYRPLPAAPATRGRGRLLAMLVGAIALGIGGFYGYRMLNPPSEPSQAGGDEATGQSTARTEGAASGPSVEPILDRVSVVVTSTPAGAQVFVAGEKTPRGTTPTVVELDRGDAPVEIVLKADGHADESARVVPNQNSSLDLVLAASGATKAGTADDDEGGEDEKKAASAERERKERSRSRERSRRSRKESSRERRSSESKSDKAETSDDKDEGRTKVGDDILRPEL